ncbi:hypothetical protein ACKWTF_015473 [Chironomus riparius]
MSAYDILSNDFIKIKKNILIDLDQQHLDQIEQDAKIKCKILKFSSESKFENVLFTLMSLKSRTYPYLFIFIINLESFVDDTNVKVLQTVLLNFSKTQQLVLQLTLNDETQFYYKDENSAEFIKVDLKTNKPDKIKDFSTFLQLFLSEDSESLENHILDTILRIDDSLLILKFIQILDPVNDDFFHYIITYCAEEGSKTELIAAMDGYVDDNGKLKGNQLKNILTTSAVLFDAIKYPNQSIVDFLIKDCGHFIRHLPIDHQIEVSNYLLAEKLLKTLCDLLDSTDFPFPNTLNHESVTDERFRTIIDTRLELFENILLENLEEIEKFANNNPNIRFAYNLYNKSAVSFALDASKFKAFCRLISLRFQGEIDKNLIKAEQFEIEKQKLSQLRKNVQDSMSNNEEVILLLLSRSFIFNRSSINNSENKYFEKIKEWYKDIQKAEFGEVLLKACSQCKDIKIIYDFECHSTENVAVTVGLNSSGVTYADQKFIFIGAKLSENSSSERHRREQKIKGIIAHEICHYVMRLVYQFEDNPFYENDKQTREEYCQVIDYIEDLISINNDDECDGIISTVFKLYNKVDSSAELIVRPVQIQVQFGDNQAKLIEIEEKFKILFDFCRHRVIPEVENFSIQQRQDIKLLNDFVGILNEISYSDISFCKGVNADEVFKHQIAIVTTNVPKMLLFNIFDFINTSAFDLLSTQNIFITTQMLKNNFVHKNLKLALEKSRGNLQIFIDCSINFSKSFNFKIFKMKENLKIIFIVDSEKNSKELSKSLEQCDLSHEKVIKNFNWMDLASESQNELLKIKICFQSCHFLSLSELIEYQESSDMSSLVDENLLNLLINNERINVNPNLIKDQIFEILNQSRNLIQAKVKAKQQSNSWHPIKPKIQTQKSLFEDILQFLSQTLLRRHPASEPEFQNIQLQTEKYEKCEEMPQNQVLERIKNQKYVLISDRAGSGKSWMLKSFTNLLKKHHLIKWTTYVDLKQFINDFKEKPQNYEIYKDSAAELIKRIADKKSITIGHPQFYKMVADITVDDKKLIFDFTMLKMFKKCVDIHYERWSHQKGDLRKDQCIQSSHKTFNFHYVHEFLAMKSLYPDEVEFGDLKLSDLDWNDEEIIACGMLNKVGDYFLFPHETFREYYAAKFIIRIIKKSENLSFEILNYFIEFLTIKNFGVIRMFINDALADEADFLKIESKMSKEFCTSLCESKSIVNIFFENLENLLNFVIKIFKNSKNQKLFKQLLFSSNKIFWSATTNSSLFINIQNLIIEHFNVNDLIEILSSNKIILSIFGSPLGAKDIQIFLNKIDQKLGSKFINKELKLKNEHEHNLLLRIIQVDHQVDNVERLEDIFEIIMKYLNIDEIIKLSKETGFCSRNVFQACIRTGDLIKIKFFWTKLEEIYKSQNIHHEFKKLISHKAVEYSNRCPIQEAAYCSDIKFHETFWELLLKTFNNRQELMDLILQEDTNFGNFIHHQVSQSSDFVVDFTLEKFKELFTNDQYLELLFSKHQSGMNLLQTAAFDSKNIKVHQLLWKIIKNACKSDQKFLKVIQHVDMLGFNLLQIASYQATSEIFQFMLQELESLTTFEEIRKILGNKSWTLFFHSFKLNNSLKYQQYLWTVIRKYLHKSEVLEMMTFVDDNEKYLCTVAARNSKAIADYTWKEIDSFLKSDLKDVMLDLGATALDLTATKLDLIASELDLTTTKLDLTTTKLDLTATELDWTATELDLTATKLDLTATDLDLTATDLDLKATKRHLTATKLDLTATELDLTATKLDLTTTELDLTATNLDLTATKLDLTATELDLTATDIDLTATKLDLRASKLDLTATELDLTATVLDLTATELDLTATKLDLTATKLDLIATEIDLTATKLDLTATELDLTAKKPDLTAIQSSRAFDMNSSTSSHRSYLLTSLKDETRQALLNFSSNVHDCQLRMSFESKLQEFVVLFRIIDSQNLMKRVISNEISIKDSNVLFRLSFCDDIEFHRMLWNHFSSKDNEELCKLMLVENIIGNNFAFSILSNDNFEVIKFIFEKFKEIFNIIQYQKIIKSKGYLNRNILEFSIVKSKNIKIIKFLWNILQDSSKDFLNLLKENEENIFQIAAKFSTAEIFGFMINELEIVAKSDEINYFFTKLNHFNENLLQLSAKFNKSQKLHEKIWMSIDKHLNKCQINEAINHTNKLGDNVLYIAVYHNSKEIVEFIWTKIKEKIVKKCDQIEYLKKNGHKKCSLYEYSVTDNINNVEVKDFIKELVKDYEIRHFTLILILIFLLLCVGMFLVLSNL